MIEKIVRNVGGITVEIRIMNDGIDLVLPHIHPEWPIAALDLFFAVARDEEHNRNNILNGTTRAFLYDYKSPESDNSVAIALWAQDGLQVIPGDGGVLSDGAIQNEYNCRANLWRE